jgi:hypothetical protein
VQNQSFLLPHKMQRGRITPVTQKVWCEGILQQQQQDHKRIA